MALNFPNMARSFDEKRGGVSFTGYDGMFEVAFLVEAAALRQLKGDVTEESSLAAFDAERNAIYDVAREVYSHGRQTRYMLTAEDFR